MKSIPSYLFILFLCFICSSCADKEEELDPCMECPVVTSIFPTIGKSGDTVTINGSNFSGVGNIVRFNGKPTKTIQETPTLIKAYVPANCGTGGVSVERSDKLLSNNDKEFTQIYQFTVSTHAGMPGSGNYYDGSITYCFLNTPSALAFDRNRDLYICDEKNYCVRKISGTQITTFAGNGKPGYQNSPDPKTSLFNTPAGIAISPNGEVFIADRRNHCIRDILPSGIATTICGKGQIPGYANGDGTDALFSFPYKMLMLDDQHFLVVDSANNRIRKSTVNGTVTTFAGSGTNGSQNGDLLTASFYLPAGMALLDAKTLLIADAGNSKIRSINLTASTVSDFAGYGKSGFSNGTLISSMFNNPSAIAVRDMNGKKEIFIADTGNNMIRMIDSKNNVSTIIGDLQPGSQNGDGVTARLNGPADLIFDPSNNGILYIADKRNHTIRKVIIE